MNQKLKNGIITGTIILSVVGLGILGGNTYSKYFTTINGEGNAVVARWSFRANDETETITNIKLSNIYNQSKLAANKIAPGTSGSFDIVLDVSGADIAIDYAVRFDNCTDKPTNLKFSYDGITANTLEELENNLKGRIALKDARTKTLTINWAWEYETGNNENTKLENDKIDTKDAGKTFTFDVIITGMQVNPEEDE